jgi:hypothetical protein
MTTPNSCFSFIGAIIICDIVKLLCMIFLRLELCHASCGRLYWSDNHIPFEIGNRWCETKTVFYQPVFAFLLPGAWTTARWQVCARHNSSVTLIMSAVPPFLRSDSVWHKCLRKPVNEGKICVWSV